MPTEVRDISLTLDTPQEQSASAATRKMPICLKAFIYGERGVWRPGDTLHVTMILADKAERLPESHPATLELYTPEGQFYTRMVSTGQDGFYTFPIATSADDPTGWWNAYVKVGGSAFHKSLHIETVKPNRLKVNLELPGDILQGGARNTARVTSSWLTGVPASGLRASATMTLSKAPATFKGFDGYTFRNFQIKVFYDMVTSIPLVHTFQRYNCLLQNTHLYSCFFRNNLSI